MDEASFVQALRAEIDAVVARYEALVRSQRAAIESSYERDVQAMRGEVESLRRQRGELERQVQQAGQRTAECEREAREVREASSREAQSLAEARTKIGELNARLDLVAEQSRVFEEVFAGEVAFTRACLGIASTPLLQAVNEAAGIEVEMTPEVYGALKRERLDAVLTRALRDRGRSVVAHPLADAEREALMVLAKAAGCEIIEPDLGARYEADQMDKVASAPDPAEESNVLACLLPGLRLAGSSGALVFPKVKVAVG